jgi:hypothetical protein
LYHSLDNSSTASNLFDTFAPFINAFSTSMPSLDSLTASLPHLIKYFATLPTIGIAKNTLKALSPIGIGFHVHGCIPVAAQYASQILPTIGTNHIPISAKVINLSSEFKSQPHQIKIKVINPTHITTLKNLLPSIFCINFSNHPFTLTNVSINLFFFIKFLIWLTSIVCNCLTVSIFSLTIS